MKIDNITYNYLGEYMNIIELILLSIGLSMDAFAVALCKGITIKNINNKDSIKIGLYFGIFQALMPLIGYFIGMFFHSILNNIDHYIAFILLSIIGIKMIKDSFSEIKENNNLDFINMLILSIATSIDAFSAGITLSILDVNIYYSISFIGIITFILSFIGTKIGSYFGNKYKNISERFGGIILISLGTKILLSHIFG